MSEANAKAQLDIEVGEGVTGYLTPDDIQDAIGIIYDDFEAADDNLVAGPASATDNALVRFDGTGGKTVQGSGITVDDSNNITSNLTMSKATPTLTLLASSGNAYADIKANAGSDIAGIGLWANAYRRWIIVKNATAESGANVGSDLVIQAYDDTGGYLTTPVTITRSTGKVRLGSVGATAGLELGSSGPRMMSGTGSPEGVVTAPVGSIWFQTDSTVGVSHWRKASGSGNTGWKVMAGDTGWRTTTSWDSAGVVTGDALGTGLIPRPSFAGGVYVRRINDTVYLRIHNMGCNTTTLNGPTTNKIWGWVSGFKPDVTRYIVASTSNYSTGVAPQLTPIRLSMGDSMVEFDYVLTMASTGSVWATEISWTTVETWPTSLPGT